MSYHPVSRRHFLQTTALALPLLTAGCRNLSPGGKRAARSEFVSVSNGQFRLRGKPYFYIGANLWFGGYLGDSTLKGGRARLVRELDRLQRIGVNNIRLLAGSEASPLRGSIPRAITSAPGVWDDELLQGLDFCLAEMARRDMRAVLFLSNYWQWSGGFAQYVRWATEETIPDPDLPEIAKGDWHAFIEFSARLYRTPAATRRYLDYVSQLIQRRNTVNGRIYREDPAIMTWELANEPRPGNGDLAQLDEVGLFADWVEKTARFIREQDVNHLICTGSEGIWGCLQKPEVFVATHKTPLVDYVTVHMWLKNWGWLADPVISPEFETACGKARAHVETHNQIATEVLRKPLVLEEFGMPRDHENYSPGSPANAREEYYRRMFEQVAESCRAGRAMQGANFWAWGGEGRPGSGTPAASARLLGDPFCEPQGLNSVYDTDHATLHIIAEANKKLTKISIKGG